MHFRPLPWHVLKKRPPAEFTELRELSERNSVTGKSFLKLISDIAEIRGVDFSRKFIP
jgi:hypothetical protein